MKKILFVCHGNICRSTMAEFVFKDMAIKAGFTVAGLNASEDTENKGLAARFEPPFDIASAATSREEIGNPVYPPTKRKLAEHGIGTSENELGVSNKRARQITETDYDYYDLIIVMDHNNLRNMRRMFGSRVDTDGKVHLMLEYANRPDEEVADPWYTGDFDATWDDVREGCGGLLKQITDERL